MLHKKAKKESGNATCTNVRKQMTKARMTRPARITELNLQAARIPERPSATMPATVDKIIPSPRPSQPETAEIALHGADRGYQVLQIENLLTDERGDDVRLKKGAHVDVTITAKTKGSTVPNSEDS
jgi:hypothetical protein